MPVVDRGATEALRLGGRRMKRGRAVGNRVRLPRALVAASARRVCGADVRLLHVPMRVKGRPSIDTVPRSPPDGPGPCVNPGPSRAQRGGRPWRGRDPAVMPERPDRHGCSALPSSRRCLKLPWTAHGVAGLTPPRRAACGAIGRWPVSNGPGHPGRRWRRWAARFRPRTNQWRVPVRPGVSGVRRP